MTAEGATTRHGRWDPRQYLRFRDQRAQPFYDLAAMVDASPGMRVVDLGCGPGELTAWLHRDLRARSTVGVDLSEDMLREADQQATDGLSFEAADITRFAQVAPTAQFDLVYSNAALQWVDDHQALLPDLRRLVAPGGQLAIQVPWRSTHPAGSILSEVVAREPYASAVSGFRRSSSTQAPDWYATRLYDLGATEQRVELRVYGHVLPNARDAVEWLKGSALTPYRSRLPDELYAQLVVEFEQEVVAQSGDGPYFMPFNRILMWARFP